MNVIIVHAREQVGQMQDRTAQPIELVDNQHTPLAQSSKRVIETRALGLAARNAVILVHALGPGPGQHVKLQIEFLVFR